MNVYMIRLVHNSNMYVDSVETATALILNAKMFSSLSDAIDWLYNADWQREDVNIVEFSMEEKAVY